MSKLHRKCNRMLVFFCFFSCLCVTLIHAVDHYKELNTIRDLVMLGYLQDVDDFSQKLPYQFSNEDTASLLDNDSSGKNKKLAFRKNTLFAFGTSDSNCLKEIRNLGFPKFLGHLGNDFETGEIMTDRFDEIGKLFGVEDGCSKEFIFVRKGTFINLSDLSKVSKKTLKVVYPQEIHTLHNPGDENTLQSWLLDLLGIQTELVNDLEFPVEINWEEFGNAQNRQITINSLEPKESFELDSFESHIFTFYNGYNKERILRIRMTKDNFDTKTVFLSELLELAKEKEYQFSGLITTEEVWGKRKKII